MFGIGDDGKLAFTTFEDADTITTVKNPAGITVQFVPVDHNIPIKNENGTDASLCDAMIHAPAVNDIYFIEMKDRNRNWISEAPSDIFPDIILLTCSDSRLRQPPTDKSHFLIIRTKTNAHSLGAKPDSV